MNRGTLLTGVTLLLLAPWHPGTAPDASAQAAGQRYWSARQLDVRPQIKTHVMPEYPAQLPPGIRGRVVLDLYISSTGNVDRARLVRAEPPGRFEDSALTAFAGARFAPGVRKGKAVPSVARIEVTYGD